MHKSEYPDVPDTQPHLREDDRIKVLERYSKQNEPLRMRNSQSLKAAGTASDCLTPVDILHMSEWYLVSAGASAPHQLAALLRDRADVPHVLHIRIPWGQYSKHRTFRSLDAEYSTPVRQPKARGSMSFGLCGQQQGQH